MALPTLWERSLRVSAAVPLAELLLVVDEPTRLATLSLELLVDEEELLTEEDDLVEDEVPLTDEDELPEEEEPLLLRRLLS